MYPWQWSEEEWQEKVTEAYYIHTFVHVVFSGGTKAVQKFFKQTFIYFILLTSAAWFWVCSCCKQVPGSSLESPFSSQAAVSESIQLREAAAMWRSGKEEKQQSESLQHMSNLLLQQSSP